MGYLGRLKGCIYKQYLPGIEGVKRYWPEKCPRVLKKGASSLQLRSRGNDMASILTDRRRTALVRTFSPLPPQSHGP
jgi:hypothetical protein